MSHIRSLALLAACALLGAFAGCGNPSSFEFDALDLMPPQEELAELSLGRYRIPIPVAVDRGQTQVTYRHRMLLDFELHALVSPSRQSQVADAYARHEGKIRDQVIRICRKATLDELQEPELSTLKARLLDELASQVGELEMRHLLFTGLVSQQM